MSINERVGVLRRRWQSADKLFRTATRESYEADARDIFGQLREAWERATTEVLLNDVVERFRHSIETKQVKGLDITEEDYKALEAGMTECSRWMRGHDRPAADGTPFPDPEALRNRIEDLATWVKNIRDRRKK